MAWWFLRVIVLLGLRLLRYEAVTIKKADGDDSDFDLPDDVYAVADTGGSSWQGRFAEQVQTEQDGQVKEKARDMRKHALEYARKDTHDKLAHHTSRGIMRREDASALSEQHDDLERTQWWGNFGQTEVETDADQPQSTRSDIEEFARNYDGDSQGTERINDELKKMKNEEDNNGRDIGQDPRIGGIDDRLDALQSSRSSTEGSEYDAGGDSSQVGDVDHDRSFQTDGADVSSGEGVADLSGNSVDSEYSGNDYAENNVVKDPSDDDGPTREDAGNGEEGNQHHVEDVEDSDEFGNDGNNMMQGGGASFLENRGLEGNAYRRDDEIAPMTSGSSQPFDVRREKEEAVKVPLHTYTQGVPETTEFDTPLKGAKFF